MGSSIYLFSRGLVFSMMTFMLESPKEAVIQEKNKAEILFSEPASVF